jgi:orotidine-5'-phosphate decarboxylase
VGAQGADVVATVAAGATADGYGMVINSSRAILYASRGADFADAAERTAIATRDAIRRASPATQQISESTEMIPGAARS